MVGWLRSSWGRQLCQVLVAVAFAVLLVGQFRMYRGATLPNERTRLYLTYALFERGELSIDEPRRRFGRVMDEATFGGHAYTDKAPGSSLLAVVPYAALRAVVAEGDITPDTLLAVGRWGVMFPTTLLGIWGFLRLGRLLGLGRTTSRMACLGWLLATASLHYAGAFFGHHIVAVLLLWVAVLLSARGHGRRVPELGRTLLAGGLAGVAVLVEYQALVGCAVWLLLVVLRPERRGITLLAFVLGMLPSLMVLLGYHQACFGGPFELGYHHLSNSALRAVHTVGIGGVLFPTWEGCFGTLFSLHRGLLTTSPFLLLAPLGLCAPRRAGRWLGLGLGASSAGFILFMMSSRTWEAGWGFGPRLLVPAMPMLVLLSALAVHRLRRWSWLPSLWRGGILAGMFGFAAIVATFPEPPVEMTNPIVDVAWPLLRHGAVAPNLVADIFGSSRVYGLFAFSLPFLAAVAYLGVRRVPHDPRKPRFCAVCLLPAVLATIVVTTGPSQSEHARARLIQLVELYQRQELPNPHRIPQKP